MTALLKVFKREIYALKNNNFMLFSVFVLPFLFITLVTATFISGVARDLPIAVLDEDSSSLSRSFVRSINAAPAVAVKYKIATPNEGEYLLKSAKVYALIIIPKDFQKDIYLQKQPKLLYYYNNQMIAVGGLITRDIKTTIQTLLIGLTASIYAKKGKPLKIVTDKTSLIRIDERIKSNPYFNYSYFLMYSLIAHIFQVLIRALNANEMIKVAEFYDNLEQAKTAFYQNKIPAFIVIPQNFTHDIRRGKVTTVAAYLDSAYLIIYKQLTGGINEVFSAIGAKIEIQSLTKQGFKKQQAYTIKNPIDFIQIPLFNPVGSYQNYIYPMVLILVLQQTMLIGIGILFGTREERKQKDNENAAILVLGRGLAYASLYLIYALIFFCYFH